MEMKEKTSTTEETVTISRAEYERLSAQEPRIAALEHQVEVLTEAVRLAQQKRFGASSERITDEGMEQLSLLFNEAEVYVQTAESKPVAVAAHERRKHEYTLDKLPEGLPVEVVEHRLEGEELVCPACGNEMSEIGK